MTYLFQTSAQVGRLSALTLAVAMMVGLTACGKKEETASKEGVVKIGSAAPLTGAIAHLGKDNENGARLAIEEVNKAGITIDGKPLKLELVGEDDAADAKTGTSVAQKLVDAKVVAVVGHLNSGVSIPASKIYSDAGIAQISPSSTNPDYTKQGFKTTYRVVGTDAQQGPALASYVIKNLSAKTIAIVDDATQYGKGLADEFEKTAKANGATIVIREATNDKATDFKAILTNIKAKKPDVIMYGGMDATGGPFAKQAKELGIASKIVGGDGVCSPTLPDLAGDASENVVCSTVGVALSKIKDGESFAKRYKERFNADVQIYSPMSYDAVMVIVDAMKRANSTDPKAILGALPQTNYAGLTGTISFDAKGDLKESFITINQFKNKKLEALDVVKM